jgi:hypothetical protein
VRRSAPVALVLVVATGCGPSAGGPFGGDPVREAWESHAGVPDCGSTEGRQGEEPAPSPASLACFDRALARGEEARLSLTYPTTEGDPIRSHFVLTDEGDVRLYEDATDDAFGSGEWTLLECFEPAWLPGVECD